MRDDDPKDAGPKPPFKTPQQEPPGETRQMAPQPDHGERSYKGRGKLAGRAALITGGDSGIGRAVAIAFAREDADVLISYLEEHEDAKETVRWVEQAGRRAGLCAARERRRELHNRRDDPGYRRPPNAVRLRARPPCAKPR
jgi:hypothetical protein